MPYGGVLVERISFFQNLDVQNSGSINSGLIEIRSDHPRKPEDVEYHKRN